MTDVFITTPARRKSVLKAWKYYATQQDKQLAILLFSYGQIAIFAQGPALSLPSLHKNTCLMGHAGWDWNWEWLTVWVAVWA